MTGHPNSDPVDEFSKYVVRLDLHFDENLLGPATGVIVKANTGCCGIWLVTAAHCFTGQRPDGSPASSGGAVPNRVVISGFDLEQEINLYGGENVPFLDPLYYFDRTADVAVIQLSGRIYWSLDSSFFEEENARIGVTLRIAQKCFIIGYSRGLQVGTGATTTPIWKTGYIASEPSIYVNGCVTLVDAWTQPGQSGSPVFVFEPLRLSNGAATMGRRCLGIYTGRTNQDSYLGMVTSVDRIIALLRKATLGQATDSI